MTMPELQNLEATSQPSSPIAFRPPKPKNNSNLAKQILAKKKVMMSGSKSDKPSKKRTCICAPTSHAGSFKCHLHRNTTAQAVQGGIDHRNNAVLNSAKTNVNCSFGNKNKPQLSRFGRAAMAGDNGCTKPERGI